MIFDAHIHYGKRTVMEKIVKESPLKEVFPCYNTVKFLAVEDYSAILKKYDVGGCAFIPFVFSEVDKSTESLETMEFAGSYKSLAYALLDEEDTSFADRHYSKILGLKEHLVLHESKITKAKEEIFSHMNRHKLILLLHSQGAKRVQYVKEILYNYPKMKIQIAHMGRNSNPRDLEYMENIWHNFKDYENIFFDTSTTREPYVIEKAVKMLGDERILFGSDIPFFMDGNGTEDIMAEQIKQIENAKISENSRERIFSENYKNYLRKGV